MTAHTVTVPNPMTPYTRVEVFSDTGAYRRKWTLPSPYATRLAVDAAHNRVFVLDYVEDTSTVTLEGGGTVENRYILHLAPMMRVYDLRGNLLNSWLVSVPETWSETRESVEYHGTIWPFRYGGNSYPVSDYGGSYQYDTDDGFPLDNFDIEMCCDGAGNVIVTGQGLSDVSGGELASTIASFNPWGEVNWYRHRIGISTVEDDPREGYLGYYTRPVYDPANNLLWVMRGFRSDMGFLEGNPLPVPYDPDTFTPAWSWVFTGFPFSPPPWEGGTPLPWAGWPDLPFYLSNGQRYVSYPDGTRALVINEGWVDAFTASPAWTPTTFYSLPLGTLPGDRAALSREFRRTIAHPSGGVVTLTRRRYDSLDNWEHLAYTGVPSDFVRRSFWAIERFAEGGAFVAGWGESPWIEQAYRNGRIYRPLDLSYSTTTSEVFVLDQNWLPSGKVTPPDDGDLADRLSTLYDPRTGFLHAVAEDADGMVTYYRAQGSGPWQVTTIIAVGTDPGVFLTADGSVAVSLNGPGPVRYLSPDHGETFTLWLT